MQCVLINSKDSSVNSSEDNNFRARERERERERERQRERERANKMVEFFRKKNKIRHSNFNGEIFYFSHGISVSKLIVKIEENNFRGIERKREGEQNGGIFQKKINRPVNL